MDVSKQIIQQSLGKRLGSALKALIRNLDQHFQEHGIPLSVEQFVMLKMLTIKQEIILQDLSLLMKKDKSHVMRQLDYMQEQRLVARIPNPDDRRKNLLVLTQAGGTLLDQALKVEEEVIQKWKKGVSENHWDIFLEVLDTLQINAGGAENDNC